MDKIRLEIIGPTRGETLAHNLPPDILYIIIGKYINNTQKRLKEEKQELETELTNFSQNYFYYPYSEAEYYEKVEKIREVIKNVDLELEALDELNTQTLVKCSFA